MRPIKAIFLMFVMCNASISVPIKTAKVLNELKFVLRDKTLADSLTKKPLPLKKGMRITKTKIQHLINIIKNMKNCEVNYRLKPVTKDKYDLIIEAASIQDFNDFQVDIVADSSKLYNRISDVASLAIEFLSSNSFNQAQMEKFKADFAHQIQIEAMNLGYCNFKIKEISIKSSFAREANVISIITEQGQICTISKINLQNHSPLSSDDFSKAIKIGIGSKFNKSKLDRSVKMMNQILFINNINYYTAEYSCSSNDQNQVSVNFIVKLSAQPRIKSINFFGNNTVRNSEILKLLPFREGDVISQTALSFATDKIKRTFGIYDLDSKININPNGTANVNFYFTKDETSILSSVLEVLQLQIGSSSSFQVKAKNLFGYPIEVRGMTYFDFWNYNSWFTNNPVTKGRFPGYGDWFCNTIEDQDFFNAINFDLERIKINFNIKRSLDDYMFQNLFFGTGSSVRISDFERCKAKNNSFCDSVMEQWAKMYKNIRTNLGCIPKDPLDEEEERQRSYLIQAAATGSLKFGFGKGSIELGNTASRFRMFTKQDAPANQGVFDNLDLELKSTDVNNVSEYKSWSNTTFANLGLNNKWQYSFGDIYANLNCKIAAENTTFTSETKSKYHWKPFIQMSGSVRYVKDEPMNVDGAKITTKLRLGKILGNCAFVNHFSASNAEPSIQDNVGPFDPKMGMNLGGRWYAGGSVRARYELVNLDDQFVFSCYSRAGVFNLSDSGGLTDHKSDSMAARGYYGTGIKFKFKLPNGAIKMRFGLRAFIDTNNLNESIDPMDFGISIGS